MVFSDVYLIRVNKCYLKRTGDENECCQGCRTVRERIKLSLQRALCSSLEGFQWRLKSRLTLIGFFFCLYLAFAKSFKVVTITVFLLRGEANRDWLVRASVVWTRTKTQNMSSHFIWEYWITKLGSVTEWEDPKWQAAMEGVGDEGFSDSWLSASGYCEKKMSPR